VSNVPYSLHPSSRSPLCGPASLGESTNTRLDVFFEHHRLFFDLSISKFRSRLTFHDRRRPSLALLNAMVCHQVSIVLLVPLSSRPESTFYFGPIALKTVRWIIEGSEKKKRDQGLTSSTCGRPGCRTLRTCHQPRRISTNKRSFTSTRPLRQVID